MVLINFFVKRIKNTQPNPKGMSVQSTPNNTININKNTTLEKMNNDEQSNSSSLPRPTSDSTDTQPQPQPQNNNESKHKYQTEQEIVKELKTLLVPMKKFRKIKDCEILINKYKELVSKDTTTVPLVVSSHNLQNEEEGTVAKNVGIILGTAPVSQKQYQYNVERL